MTSDIAPATVTRGECARDASGALRISAVIPAYNSAAFLRECLDGVLAQTLPADEILVVDDGSTDDTPGILAEYGDRIKVIRQDNQGVSAARNTGILQARGDWIAFLDADDVWHPRKLELQTKFLRASADPDLALLGTAADNQPAPKTFPDDFDLNSAVQPLSLAEIAVRCYFSPSSALVRKNLFNPDQAGLFDTTLHAAEDPDMWIRIANHANVAVLNAPLFWYRPHAASKSHSVAIMEEHTNRMIAKNFAAIPALRSRPSLRRKSQALAWYASAYRYANCGQPVAALTRLFRSFLTWPRPFSKSELNWRFGRCKLVLRNLKQCVRKPRKPRRPQS